MYLHLARGTLIGYTSLMQEITWHPTYTQPLRSQLQTTLELWHSEVIRILPSFPGTLKIEFDNDFFIPGYNVGGAAWDEQYLKLAYDPTEPTDREAQFAELRAIYFHEGYHLARGVSFVTSPDDLPALTNAIEEGLATKFEVVYTGSTPGYAKYEDRGTMLDWLEEVRRLPDGFDYDW